MVPLGFLFSEVITIENIGRVNIPLSAYVEWDLQAKGLFGVLHPSNWLLLDNPNFPNSLLMNGINDSVKQSIPKYSVKLILQNTVLNYCKMIPSLILTECAHGKLTSD